MAVPVRPCPMAKFECPRAVSCSSHNKRGLVWGITCVILMAQFTVPVQATPTTISLDITDAGNGTAGGNFLTRNPTFMYWSNNFAANAWFLLFVLGLVLTDWVSTAKPRGCWEYFRNFSGVVLFATGAATILGPVPVFVGIDQSSSIALGMVVMALVAAGTFVKRIIKKEKVDREVMSTGYMPLSTTKATKTKGNK
eukprot:GHVS01062204.1.p1 GENE.GHVS01062204.1~~GHVS01062204.1.p1  ORF type:complete len:196 (+),score=10.44 GHVS01062204.1:335-922(+)